MVHNCIGRGPEHSKKFLPYGLDWLSYLQAAQKPTRYSYFVSYFCNLLIKLSKVGKTFWGIPELQKDTMILLLPSEASHGCCLLCHDRVLLLSFSYRVHLELTLLGCTVCLANLHGIIEKAKILTFQISYSFETKQLQLQGTSRVNVAWTIFTELRFASLLYGEFTTVTIINPPN